MLIIVGVVFCLDRQWRSCILVQGVLRSFGIHTKPTDELTMNFSRGTVGTALHPLDKETIGLNPTRVFLENELVAWEDRSPASELPGEPVPEPVFRYGRVVSQSFGDSLGLGLSKVNVLMREGTGRNKLVKEVPSTEVWTFAGTATRTTQISAPVPRRRGSNQKAGGASDSAPSTPAAATSSPTKASSTTLTAVKGLLQRVGISLEGGALDLVREQ